MEEEHTYIDTSDRKVFFRSLGPYMESLITYIPIQCKINSHRHNNKDPVKEFSKTAFDLC